MLGGNQEPLTMLAIGDRVVVRTPDRRSYYGRLLEMRQTAGNAQVVVRLDTGWVTAYPAHMVHPLNESQPDPASPDQ
jgi:hypothetical protein